MRIILTLLHFTDGLILVLNINLTESKYFIHFMTNSFTSCLPGRPQIIP